jgi:hypothetical protein
VQKDTPMDAPDLLTIREVARELGVRTHRATYAVDQFDIEPRQRAGVIRLFSRDQLPEIRSAITRIAGNREAANAGH